MARYVALLRGINVGRAKRIGMADLRELLADLGYTDVVTLLQSGNAVFTASGRSTGPIVQAIERAIADRYSFDVRVLLRTQQQFAAAVEANPLPVPDGSRFLVSFLDRDPPAARLRDLDPAEFEPERFALGSKVLYLWCANGIIDSALLSAVSDQRLGVVSTARNWNTVTKLLALAEK
jgi:uncharacterized protein (DUF1697 family)